MTTLDPSATALDAAFDHWRSLAADNLLTGQAESARAHLRLLAEDDLSHLTAQELQQIAAYLSPGWAHTGGLLARVIYHNIWWANRRLLAAMFRLNWHGGKLGFQFLPDAAEVVPDDYAQQATALYEMLHEGTQGDARSILTGDDLAFFESLPPSFTIYRGASGIPPEVGALGLCWTTRREIAEWFANRRATCAVPILLSARIRKADLLFVKASEFEVVAHPERWRPLRCPSKKARPSKMTWTPGD